MHSQIQQDDISLVTFKREMEGYTWDFFRQDALAAISVALLTVPQAMANALLAGLPLSSGILASIYSSIIAALFGSSRHLIVGPSNAIAILIQSATAATMYNYYRDVTGPEKEVIVIQILTQLSLLIGMMQVLAAGFKLGRLTQFVSHSVVVAYVTGTAIAVIVNQLFTFFGVPQMPGDHSLYQKLFYLAMNFKYAHLPTTVIAVCTFALLILLKRIDRRIPAAVISLLLAAVAVHYFRDVEFNFSMPYLTHAAEWSNVLLVGDTGSLHEVIPAFAFPYFDLVLLSHLLPFAFAIALLGIMETSSVAKSIAASSGQRLSINQEIFGIGMGNLLSSFISAMPVSGSASRTGLNYSLGAQTRMSAVLAASFIASILYGFGDLIMQIPLAALSALLLVTAVHIVHPKQFFLCVKATNSDSFVLWMTLLSCIFLSLDVAFYIGIVTSITLYLKKSAVPQLVEYDIDESGELHNLNNTEVQEHRTIRVIKVEGELFFGAADLFQTTLKTIAEDDTSTRVIILQLKNARDIDATACLALQQLHEYLRGSGRFLICCGITQQVWDVLSDSGMVEQLRKENLFIFDERHPHSHMTKALKRARKLCGISVMPSAHMPVPETIFADPIPVPVKD